MLLSFASPLHASWYNFLSSLFDRSRAPSYGLRRNDDIGGVGAAGVTGFVVLCLCGVGSPVSKGVARIVLRVLGADCGLRCEELGFDIFAILQPLYCGRIDC